MTTSATATAYSNQRKLDRCQNGVLWAAYDYAGTLAADGAAALRYSTDDGKTWLSGGYVMNGSGGTSGTYIRNGSFFIDLDDYAHYVFKDNHDGFIYYRRGTPNAARTAWTWSAAQVYYNADAGLNYPDTVVHREGTGWVAHVTASYIAGSGFGVVDYGRFTIASDGVISAVSRSGISAIYDTPTGHQYPSIDFRHTGDGKTVSANGPDLFMAWSAGATGAGKGIRFKKAVYSAGSWTWNAEREIDSTRHFSDTLSDWWGNCLFDGTRVIIAAHTTGTQSVVLYERDVDDTTTTTRVLMTGSNYLFSGSATYDTEGNVYFFGFKEGAAENATLYYRKFTRSTLSISDYFELGPVGSRPHTSTKRSSSNSRIEWIYTAGNNSPYQVKYDRILLEENLEAWGFIPI